MKRGEIWIVSGSGYAGKPRPAVIVQDDRFDATASVTIEAPLIRLPVEPSESNGLRSVSRLMADKITTVPKTRFGQRIGQLSALDMERLSHAIVRFLGLREATVEA